MDWRIMAEDLAFPEGPVVMDDGSVILVEIAAGRVTRLWGDGRRETVAEPGGGPNGAALGPDGALYVCNNGGFAWGRVQGLLIPGHQADDYAGGRVERIDLATGRVDRLFDQCEGHPLSGPNDLVFDAQGGFWFTDMGKTRHHDRDQGGLFWARADGSVVKPAAYPLDGPNGVGLSPDGRTVYVALTHQRLILGFDIVGEGEVGAPEFGALPGRVVASFPGRTLLDSMAMMADGRIAQATLVERSGIAWVDPADGSYEIAEAPDLLTTNVAFGGDDMQDIWVTLSTTGRLARGRAPAPGLRLHGV